MIDDRHGHAAAHDAIRNRSIRLDFLQRVTKNSPNHLRIAEHKRQRMLQRIAGRTLKTEDVLIDVSLGKNGLAEERIVRQVAAKVVIVPRGLSLDPWLGGHTKANAIRFPGGTGTRPRVRRVGL